MLCLKFNYLPSDLWWKVLLPLVFLAVIAVLVPVGVVWCIRTKQDWRGYNYNYLDVIKCLIRAGVTLAFSINATT